MTPHSPAHHSPKRQRGTGREAPACRPRFSLRRPRPPLTLRAVNRAERPVSRRRNSLSAGSARSGGGRSSVSPFTGFGAAGGGEGGPQFVLQGGPARRAGRRRGRGCGRRWRSCPAGPGRPCRRPRPATPAGTPRATARPPARRRGTAASPAGMASPSNSISPATFARRRRRPARKDALVRLQVVPAPRRRPAAGVGGPARRPPSAAQPQPEAQKQRVDHGRGGGLGEDDRPPRGAGPGGGGTTIIGRPPAPVQWPDVRRAGPGRVAGGGGGVGSVGGVSGPVTPPRRRPAARRCRVPTRPRPPRRPGGAAFDPYRRWLGIPPRTPPADLLRPAGRGPAERTTRRRSPPPPPAAKPPSRPELAGEHADAARRILYELEEAAPHAVRRPGDHPGELRGAPQKSPPPPADGEGRRPPRRGPSGPTPSATETEIGRLFGTVVAILAVGLFGGLRG